MVLVTQESSAKDRTRHVWMLTLRGIAMVLVISHHAIQVILTELGSAPTVLVILDDAMGPFRMPALVFVSGMLLQRSLQKSRRQYFLGKLGGIGWPYVLWSLIALTVIGNWSQWILVEVVFLPPTVYWYLWFLLAYYGLAYVTRGVHPTVLIGLSLALAIILPGGLRLDRFFLLFAFFVAGDWAMRTREHWQSAIRRRWVVSVFAVTALGTAILAAVGVIERYSMPSLPGALAAIGLGFALLPMTDSWQVFAPLRFVGQTSLIYYVTHWPTMVLVGAPLVASGANEVVVYLALIVISLAVATAFAFATKRWPLVDVLFRWPATQSR